MTSVSTRTKERVLLCVVLAAILSAGLLPPLTQDQAYHAFADTRSFLGIPRAADVLSNVGFLVGGMWGLWLSATRRLRYFSPTMGTAACVFFTGMVCTAVGSAVYHANPQDYGLAIDRYGMVVAFAGMLGMCATQRVTDRAGGVLLGSTFAIGVASVAAWQVTGSLTSYALMQFGGIALVLGMSAATPRGAGPLWSWMLVSYAAAKLAEHWDTEIFEMTAQMVSGHTLKHLLAAVPAWATIRGFQRESLPATP